VLDLGLPRAYAPELFEEKTAAVFQHVYDAYHGAGRLCPGGSRRSRVAAGKA